MRVTMKREAGNVQGKWHVTIETPAGARSGVLELSSDGRSLTGFMSDGERRVPIADGRVDGNELQWTAKITKPMSLNLKFTAKVESDEINGVARHFLGTASFRGRRA
jgi:hypothetical protein